MSMVQEFKKFAMRGNVVDMAVGIIIGVAFGKIVSSFVSDVIMPPLGLLMGGVDFKDLAIVLKEAVGDTPAVVIAYGQFIQTIVDFVIIAFAIFIAIKVMNSLKAKEEAAPDWCPVFSVSAMMPLFARVAVSLIVAILLVSMLFYGYLAGFIGSPSRYAKWLVPVFFYTGVILCLTGVIFTLVEQFVWVRWSFISAVFNNPAGL